MIDPKNVSTRWRIAHSEASMGWGGQEHRVLAELTGFQRRGCKVWLLADKDSELFRRSQQAGIETVPVDFSKNLFPLNVLKFYSWLRKNRVQILNPHSSKDGWLFGVAGRVAGVPMLIRTRHIDVDYPNPLVSRHAFTTFADHVLTTSDKITNRFRSIFGIPENRITTLPTGIDPELYSPGDRRPALSRGQEEGEPVVGMISVLRSWKGHMTFLEAARRLMDRGVKVRFVITGEGPYRGPIEERMRELKIGEVVTLAGHSDRVEEVLRNLDLLVIPSLGHEGIPQIGLQALACETPVIGSDAGGIPEIIRDGVTGRIFKAGDSEMLAGLIQQTLENPSLASRMVRAGRAQILARHSMDAMLNALDALYLRHFSNRKLKWHPDQME